MPDDNEQKSVGLLSVNGIKILAAFKKQVYIQNYVTSTDEILKTLRWRGI